MLHQKSGKPNHEPLSARRDPDHCSAIAANAVGTGKRLCRIIETLARIGPAPVVRDERHLRV
jgi:hypothetical protein